ncbi:MAG: Hpt domain-containing protein [Holophaga sp.]|nr:Hpt domain-containing protein [Holophaga sp.]
MEPNPDPGLSQEPFDENLDLSVMDQLLNLDDGELGLLKEMLDLFTADTPDRIKAIEATLASGDLADMADVAHAIKGAAGTMGAPRLRTIAAELEGAGRKGSFGIDASLLLEQLKETYADAVAALETFIARKESLG